MSDDGLSPAIVRSVAASRVDAPGVSAGVAEADASSIGASTSAGADSPTKGDCYSDGERAWMERTQRLRGAVLAPFFRVCERLGVTPDHLTLASLASGLAFWPLWFVSAPAALFALFMHVVLDGIDGPLARHQGVASRRGSFTDTLSDQAVVTTTTIALMTSGHIGVVPGSLYIYAYAVVVAFAMVRNSLEIPYTWLVRPRFVVYVWIAVDTALLPGSLNVLVWVCAGVLAAKMLSGFLKLRSRL